MAHNPKRYFRIHLNYIVIKNNHYRLFSYSTILLLACLSISIISIINSPAIAKKNTQSLIETKSKIVDITQTPTVEEPKNKASDSSEQKKVAKQKADEAETERIIRDVMNVSAILLHIIEIAGLGTLFWIMKKSNNQTEYQIRKLDDKLNAVDGKIRAKNNTPLSNNSDSINIQRLEHQLNAMQKQLSMQQERSASSQQQNYSPQRES